MLRVDVHVLDHDGNLTDAAGLAALAALMAFRRPFVEVGGGSSEQDQVYFSSKLRTNANRLLDHDFDGHLPDSCKMLMDDCMPCLLLESWGLDDSRPICIRASIFQLHEVSCNDRAAENPIRALKQQGHTDKHGLSSAQHECFVATALVIVPMLAQIVCM